ncbi:snare protein syntaxin 18/UFE1 [Mucidula mucida]|nr:snare protein syntaxin 18/UFE1 [Mucidula mucida]
MAHTDRTADFKNAVQASSSSGTTQKRRLPREHHTDIPGGKEYVAEAYKILSHISNLSTMLGSIRKPYLNVDSRRRHHGSTSRTLDLTGDQQSWSSIQQLSNEERDQIDLQARLILSRCADRVKEMEALEKRRTELLASKSNTLARWLPTRLRTDESAVASDVTAAHRSSITWYLSRRLAEASQNQKGMQEERVKRELERSRTLGSGAAREAMNITMNPTAVREDREASSSWLGDASSSLLAATIGATPRSSHFDAPPIETPNFTDDEDDDIELSASQILQFEEENASILRGVQDTLESVQQAESRLLDISALQMELVSHLTQQTELTDQLYEDAVATTASMEKGNVQLREARRRAKDGRLFILVFLIGASLSLLFLHYY